MFNNHQLVVRQVSELNEEYTDLKLIGEGTYGRFYQARNVKTNTVLALKCVKIPKNCTSSTLINMTENEWSFLKTLDHPGIIRLIDVFKDANTFYLVTE